MEIQKFKEISSSVYRNIQSLTPEGITILKEILNLKTIKYGRICTFSVADSLIIILLTLKQNCLILIKFLIENGIQLPDDLLNEVVNLLLEEKGKEVNETIQNGVTNDLNAHMEIERISKQIFKSIIDIIYITGYNNNKIVSFLENKNMPDDLSINLALSINCEYKSFELIVLNKLLVGPVLFSVIESYHEKLRPVVKEKIINELIKQMENGDKKIIYQIFYMINEKNDEVLKTINMDHSGECLGCILSLIHDKESAEIAYEKLTGFFTELEVALEVLINESNICKKKLRKEDEELIEKGLECINKLIKYSLVRFYKFLSTFQRILKIPVNRKIKGFIYEILSFYVSDRNIYIEKVMNCREEIEIEIREKSIFILPRFIRFLNAYRRREEIEKELISEGKSLGSPYIRHQEGEKVDFEEKDYFIYGLKSEDPESVMECIDGDIDESIIEMNAIHIRNAMVKDIRVGNKLLGHQIANKKIIKSVAIINMILRIPNINFFKYTELFEDFSMYLNGDVLERIGDNLEEGLAWLAKNYSTNVGRWILNNSSYFNDLILGNELLQHKLLPIYERIFDDNAGHVKIIIMNEDQSSDNTFFVSDKETAVCDEFFRVFAKQIIYEKFYNEGECEKFLLKKKYINNGFILYLKAKIVCGFDITNDLDFMKANLLDMKEILGYLSIVAAKKYNIENYIEKKEYTNDILLNFENKNSSHFLKHFSSASDFEKFVLFFSLKEVTKEIDYLIKDEIMKNIGSKNHFYLRMCIVHLFKCSNLDKILKILEKNFNDKNLLFKLNIYNISIGGKYCSKILINQVDSSLRAKAIFFLYHFNLWDKDYLYELIDKLDSENTENLKDFKKNYLHFSDNKIYKTTVD